MIDPLLSICVPSYNRPEQLGKLLSTVDCDPGRVEIVISEDAAPRRQEVRKVVREFRRQAKYRAVYEENPSNLGYDANIRRLIEIASGMFVLFLGDDDWFKRGAIDTYLTYLEENTDVGYVLRSHFAVHPDGLQEPFRYLAGARRFPPSLDVCAWMYKRSVSIGGVTFNRKSALKFATHQFDGTLLYQLHLVLEICSREQSAYSDIPVVVSAQSFRKDKPQFGTSVREKSRYQPGRITARNSINFTKGFFEISEAFDRKYGTNITSLIRNDLSRHSYPFLAIQRKRGVCSFLHYSISLSKETMLNTTWYYYFYTVVLLVFGERVCDRAILLTKQFFGHTPNLSKIRIPNDSS